MDAWWIWSWPGMRKSSRLLKMNPYGKLQLISNSEYAVCAQILRLFFGRSSQQGDELIFPFYSGQITKSPQGVIITVSADTEVDSEELTGLRQVKNFPQDRLRPSVRLEISLQAEDLHKFYCQTNLPDFRRNLKRELYLALSFWTGIKFPWGSLTGVRPTQIFSQLLESCGREEAGKILTTDWGVSKEKTELGIEVAAAEDAIVSRYDQGEDYVVYCGLPFCPTRCSNCSFTTRDAGRYADKLELYVEAMLREAGQFFHGRTKKAAAIYFGGGTPTSLPADLFARYTTGLLDLIPHDDKTELTMEAGRPDTLDTKMLEIIRAAGFARLCINPQTMHDSTLTAIGRRHTVADTLAAYRLAREIGDFIINMDLIYGLPGERSGDFLSSLEQVLALKPENITLHSLALKQSARLMEDMQELAKASARPMGGISEPVKPLAVLIEDKSELMKEPSRRMEDKSELAKPSARLMEELKKIHPDPLLAQELAEAYKRLRSNNYSPYYLYKQKRSRGALENTGFSKPGCESVYNVLMMSDRFTVIGLGSGATSKFIQPAGLVRQHNSKDLADYMNKVTEYVEKKLQLLTS